MRIALSLVLVLSAIIGLTTANHGCSLCSQRLQINDEPNCGGAQPLRQNVEVIYQGQPCPCQRALPYEVEVPLQRPDEPLYSYNYNVVHGPQPAPAPPRFVYDYQLQVPAVKQDRRLFGLTSKVDRMVLPAPDCNTVNAAIETDSNAAYYGTDVNGFTGQTGQNLGLTLQRGLGQEAIQGYVSGYHHTTGCGCPKVDGVYITPCQRVRGPVYEQYRYFNDASDEYNVDYRRYSRHIRDKSESDERSDERYDFDSSEFVEANVPYLPDADNFDNVGIANSEYSILAEVPQGSGKRRVEERSYEDDYSDEDARVTVKGNWLGASDYESEEDYLTGNRDTYAQADRIYNDFLSKVDLYENELEYSKPRVPRSLRLNEIPKINVSEHTTENSINNILTFSPLDASELLTNARNARNTETTTESDHVSIKKDLHGSLPQIDVEDHPETNSIIFKLILNKNQVPKRLLTNHIAKNMCPTIQNLIEHPKLTSEEMGDAGVLQFIPELSTQSGDLQEYEDNRIAAINHFNEVLPEGTTRRTRSNSWFGNDLTKGYDDENLAYKGTQDGHLIPYVREDPSHHKLAVNGFPPMSDDPTDLYKTIDLKQKQWEQLRLDSDEDDLIYQKYFQIPSDTQDTKNKYFRIPEFAKVDPELELAKHVNLDKIRHKEILDPKVIGDDRVDVEYVRPDRPIYMGLMPAGNPSNAQNGFSSSPTNYATVSDDYSVEEEEPEMRQPAPQRPQPQKRQFIGSPTFATGYFGSPSSPVQQRPYYSGVSYTSPFSNQDYYYQTGYSNFMAPRVQQSPRYNHRDPYHSSSTWQDIFRPSTPKFYNNNSPQYSYDEGYGDGYGYKYKRDGSSVELTSVEDDAVKPEDEEGGSSVERHERTIGCILRKLKNHGLLNYIKNKYDDGLASRLSSVIRNFDVTRSKHISKTININANLGFEECRTCGRSPCECQRVQKPCDLCRGNPCQCKKLLAPCRTCNCNPCECHKLVIPKPCNVCQKKPCGCKDVKPCQICKQKPCGCAGVLHSNYDAGRVLNKVFENKIQYNNEPEFATSYEYQPEVPQIQRINKQFTYNKDYKVDRHHHISSNNVHIQHSQPCEHRSQEIIYNTPCDVCQKKIEIIEKPSCEIVEIRQPSVEVVEIKETPCSREIDEPLIRTEIYERPKSIEIIETDRYGSGRSSVEVIHDTSRSNCFSGEKEVVVHESIEVPQYDNAAVEIKETIKKYQFPLNQAYKTGESVKKIDQELSYADYASQNQNYASQSNDNEFIDKNVLVDYQKLAQVQQYLQLMSLLQQQQQQQLLIPNYLHPNMDVANKQLLQQLSLNGLSPLNQIVNPYLGGSVGASKNYHSNVVKSDVNIHKDVEISKQNVEHNADQYFRKHHHKYRDTDSVESPSQSQSQSQSLIPNPIHSQIPNQNFLNYARPFDPLTLMSLNRNLNPNFDALHHNGLAGRFYQNLKRAVGSGAGGLAGNIPANLGAGSLVGNLVTSTPANGISDLIKSISTTQRSGDEKMGVTTEKAEVRVAQTGHTTEKENSVHKNVGS